MEKKGQDRESTPLESVRDSILMFADRKQTEGIMKKIQEQLSLAREEGKKVGIEEGWRDHNRFFDLLGLGKNRTREEEFEIDELIKKHNITVCG